MAVDYMDSKTNQRKSKEKLYLFSAAACINLFVIFFFFYTQNKVMEHMASVLIISTLYISIVILMYYFICPLQLKMVSVVFFLLTQTACVVSVGLLLFFLLETGIFKYPDFVHANMVSLEIKVTFFMICGILSFYVSHSFYLFLNTYQLSADRMDHLINGYTKEINELRMQYNPYFMYSYLINTDQLLKEDKLEKALEYNTAIASLLNKQLTYTHAKYISLEEELSWLRNYLDTEKSISKKPFSYTIHIADPELMLQTLPPFLLQPVIEGILHGNSADIDSIRLIIDICDLPDAGHTGILIVISGLHPNYINDLNHIPERISIINLEKRIELINNLKEFQLSCEQSLTEEKFSVILTIKEFQQP